MPLIVQDDNGTTPGANAYIDVAFFKAYHDDRGNVYAPYTDPDIEKAIIRATGYMDTRFAWKGYPVHMRRTDQQTAWPRSSCWDKYGAIVIGIPFEVKQASAEYALRALTTVLQPDPVRDPSGAPVRKKLSKVDVIETSVEYGGAGAGASVVLAKYPAADAIIKAAGLVRAGGGTLVRA